MASISYEIRAARFISFYTSLLRLYFRKCVWQPKNMKKSELSFTSPLADEQENEVIFSKSFIEFMGKHERDHRFPNSSFRGFSLNQTAAEESLDKSLRVGEEMETLHLGVCSLWPGARCEVKRGCQSNERNQVLSTRTGKDWKINQSLQGWVFFNSLSGRRQKKSLRRKDSDPT